MTDIEQNYERDESNEVSEKVYMCRRDKVTKTVLALLLLGFIIYVIIDSQGDQHLRQISQSFLKWVETNPIAGIFSFVGVYFIATGLLHSFILLTSVRVDYHTLPYHPF